MSKELELIQEANELIRSFHAIIERKGLTTNWAAIKQKVESVLSEQHRYLLSVDGYRIGKDQSDFLQHKVAVNELLTKYGVTEEYYGWGSDDNWISVELHRLMHNGDLPDPGDESVIFITDFLDHVNDDNWYKEKISSFKLTGIVNKEILIITAKRMVYLLADQIIEELNNRS